MSNIKETTLICSACHRPVPPFERVMQEFVDNGFTHIWIIDTGACEMKKCWRKYSGPCERLIDPGPHTPFALWDMDIPEYIERIVLIDHDCFIVDVSDIIEYINAFIEGGYDLVTLPSFRYPQTDEAGSIIVPRDLSNFYDKIAPAGISYSIWKKDFWVKVPIPDLASAENYWLSISQLNPKYGVRRIDPNNHSKDIHAGGYSQWDKGRFVHVGNLLSAYNHYDGTIKNWLSPGGRHNNTTEVRGGYFVKYFPEAVGKDSLEQQKINLAKWEEFLRETVGTDLL